MAFVGRRFGLSDVLGSGVSCSDNGLYVGTVPLLEWHRGEGKVDQWVVRMLSELNSDLSKRYGLPVEFGRKVGGLQVVARALSRGDIVHAQIATLHLEIPNPPSLAKSQTIGDLIDLARELQASGLLKVGWDPAKHPRWPTGSPDGIGGEFAPSGSKDGDSVAESAPIMPAQITIPIRPPSPIPLPFRLPGEIPLPRDILPPLGIPDVNPRSNLKNPYPDREGCDEEWEHALAYCQELVDSKKMGETAPAGSATRSYNAFWAW
jgi:hypothetical protein